MVLPIVFALGALVCAALNDIVFRKYASLRLSVGWYVSTIGFSWALLQLLLDLAAACAHPISAKKIAGLARKFYGMCQLDDFAAHALEGGALHQMLWLRDADRVYRVPCYIVI